MTDPASRPAPRIAYLVNQYPAVSHSFIRTEIRELEQQGAAVLRIAMRGWEGRLVDPADEAERALTRHVLRGGALPLVAAAMRTAAAHPRRFAAAVRAAVRLARGGERGLLVHAIYLLEACQALAWIRRFGAVHVHAHFGSNAAAVALLVRALGGPPYSFTVHGPEEFDKPLQLKLRAKVAAASAVVAITSFCRGQLHRWSDAADWPRIAVVGCGLDDAFLDRDAADRSASRRFVCVGRLCEQKGQLLLVEAAALLRARGVALEVVLVGEGEMRAAIERRIAREGLGDTVRLVGAQGSAEVRAFLDSARAMVLPSFAEGLPVVIMEAMALGCPPISTYIAGIPELVRDGIDGLLVVSGDAAALAEAMERMLAMPAEDLARMGASAQARVHERHAIRDQASKLLRIFTDAAEKAVAP